jgi:hypothetical protein
MGTGIMSDIGESPWMAPIGRPQESPRRSGSNIVKLRDALKTLRPMRECDSGCINCAGWLNGRLILSSFKMDIIGSFVIGDTWYSLSVWGAGGNAIETSNPHSLGGNSTHEIGADCPAVIIVDID